MDTHLFQFQTLRSTIKEDTFWSSCTMWFLLSRLWLETEIYDRIKRHWPGWFPLVFQRDICSKMHSFCLDPAINSKSSGFHLRDFLKVSQHTRLPCLSFIITNGTAKVQGPFLKENVWRKFTLKFIEQTLNLMHGNVIEMSYSHNTFLCRFSLY